jgi:hypothetical protein
MPQVFGAPSIGSVIATGSQTISIDSVFNLASVPAGNPTYIDVTALDRSEYAYAKLPQLGYFQANGVTLSEKNTYGDDYGAGIIYTYLAQTGQYFNSTYGYLSQLSYVSSASQYDNTYLTIVGSNNLSTLSTTYISGTSTPISQDALILVNNAAYNNTPVLGSVDVVTDGLAALPTPTQATPSSIVGAANSFKGIVWNNNGCWTLASNIAAKAGSSLPISTSLADGSGAAQANGEWIVVYNGGLYLNPTIAQAEQILLPGDILTVAWSLTGPDQGGGHITTVVSGSGVNATVLDNIQISGAKGNIIDANDVSVTTSSLNSDLTYNQAIASSIVVYRLDTPTITVKSSINAVYDGGALKLSPLFSATDAGGLGLLPITQYAFYDVGTGAAQSNEFVVNGVAVSAHTSASEVVVTAANLSSVQLGSSASLAAGTDAIYVSAYNGSYWGDWVSLGVQQASAISINASSPYTVKAANLSLLGDTGTDTVVINSAASNFSINANSYATNSWSIIDNTGALGTTSVSNVSRLAFSTGNIALDIGATQNAGGAYMLYQAAFNRTPDLVGLGFWIYSLDVGTNINTVAGDFITSPEFIGLYGANPTNSSFVTNLYANVLHRTPDTNGYNFWMGLLSGNNSLAMKSAILEDFASSPENVANVAAQIAHGISYQAYVG